MLVPWRAAYVCWGDSRYKDFSSSPIHAPDNSGSWPVAWGFRCQSSQASQSIHYPRNSDVIRRDGGCCISWQVYGWVGLYFDLVWYIVMRLSWPYDSYSLDKLLEYLVCFWCLMSKAVNWMIYNRLFVDRFFCVKNRISNKKKIVKWGILDVWNFKILIV